MESRVKILEGHLREPILGTNPCSAATAHRQLPRFDAVIMEHYMCDNPSLRDEVYELFRQHPELLVAEEEGLSKGKSPRKYIGI